MKFNAKIIKHEKGLDETQVLTSKYEPVYDYKQIYRDGDYAKVDFNLEDYADVEVTAIPELSFKFIPKENELLLKLDSEFAENYEFSIVDGILYITNKEIL